MNVWANCESTAAGALWYGAATLPRLGLAYPALLYDTVTATPPDDPSDPGYVAALSG